MSSTSSLSVSSSKGTKTLTTRVGSKTALESTKKSAEKSRDKEVEGGASAGPVTTAGFSSESSTNTRDKNVTISTSAVKSQDTKISTAKIVPTHVSDIRDSADRNVSLFSTEKTIEFERKTLNSATLPRKGANTNLVSQTMVEVQNCNSDTKVDEKMESESLVEEGNKTEGVKQYIASSNRKESVADIIEKTSELNEIIVAEESSLSAGDELEKSVSKVVEENNDCIVRSDDDDNEEDDENINNDSAEHDVQNIQTTQYANKSRKESATSSVFESMIKSDAPSSNNSNRKYSQKFINPFEPPIPELVNKSALIEEFNSVQEENLKNSFKSLTEESWGEQYFTSQALNNATSATINQVRSKIH